MEFQQPTETSYEVTKRRIAVPGFSPRGCFYATIKRPHGLSNHDNCYNRYNEQLMTTNYTLLNGNVDHPKNEIKYRIVLPDFCHY